MSGLMWTSFLPLALLVFLRTYAQPPRPSNAQGTVAKSDELLEDLKKDLEMLERLENSTDDNRASRGLLKKLSFLTGLKMGTIFQSSGTLAASNSIRIFSKIMNSAVSISYGSESDALGPLPMVRVESSLPCCDQISTRQSTIRPEVEPTTTPTEDPVKTIRNSFIRNHNDVVERVNQKFWKDKFTGRDSS